MQETTSSAEPTSLSSTASELLRRYREGRDPFRAFDDFDNILTRMETGNARSEDVGEPLSSIAKRLFTIARDGFFLLHVCGWKIHYVADGLMHAIETQNPIALANSTRSLVEHIAALAFVLQHLRKLQANLQGQGSEPRIIESLARTESTLHRAYYGTSPKGKDKAQAAPHIESECLVALEPYVKDIHAVYDFLCEYVHPNYGSNLLVSTGKLGRGRLNPPADFHKQTIERFLAYVSRAMTLLDELELSVACEIVVLDDLADRCLVKGAKMSAVFSQRNAEPEGDGKSKETAFFFPKARSALESITMGKEYLRKKKIEIKGNRYPGAVGDDFIYDVYPTASGHLWFKVPLMKF